MEKLTAQLFDLVDRISTSPSLAEVWDCFLAASSRVGLEHGVACFLPNQRTANFLVVTHALPPGWLEDYGARNLQAGDLLAERLRDAEENFAWAMTDWQDAALSDIQRAWRDANIARGLVAGLGLSDRRRRDTLFLVLIGSGGEIHPRDRLVLDVLGDVAMRRMRALGVHCADVLSQRERECLQWVQQGKTDWEIGQILDLSEKTVNAYVERAKVKYGVSTRAQAVLLAYKAGAIRID
jgi:LuxR family quorum sensing-dependent transcriptional regulator